MDSDRVILVAGVTAVAAVVGTFILWGPSTAIRPKRKGTVVGLQNLGLTCYLNSLLQAMASCHYFVEWLNTQENQGEVAVAMRKLSNVLCGRTAPVDDEYFVSPVEVVNALHHSGWKITNSQQDVHELLCNLITILEEEAHKSCVDLMISVDAVRSDCYAYADKENIWPVSLANDRIQRAGSNKDAATFANDGDNDDHDDTSHRDLNNAAAAADLRSIGGIGCEGDASACYNFSQIRLAATATANETTVSPTAASKLIENRSKSASKMKNCRVPRPRTAHDLNQSPRPSPFRGYLTNKIECTKCNYKSVLRYDKFDSISLHLPEPNDVNAHTLSSLLNNFVKNELISGITCEGCNKNRPPNTEPITAPAVKLLRFGKLPSCLCIHIVRTSFHEYGVYKRQDYVDFPEYIVMDPYLYKPRKNNAFTVKKNTLAASAAAAAAESNNGNIVNGDFEGSATHSSLLNSAKHVYRLKAVIVHRGSHNDGHFMTYRRGTAGSQTQHRWYLVSDTEVKETTLYNVIASVAYVLFYEKCSVLL
ncbi:ubiquitin carboxyl-terminal hydrolase 30 homolog isoform X2 [Planococcus citri]|uniref:ubiquitin carboxyl-terminal hydrolase 30 homolog isoform X2 n=1 Tax=Planococcus citri TaxID=170843 RepID=UPI0031F910A0